MKKITLILNKLQDAALLMVRGILAYGFYEPAKTKWEDIHSVGEWFEGMGMPMPYLNAYLSASFEMAGVFLLLLGLLTRWISFPLIVIMIVAIKTVHWENGFAASDNGFEIPLYYMIMLFVLVAFGGGKYSVDYWLWERKN
ncbi:MAG: hypothetical protein KatS3mg027_0756 [Bacteroidia bacterium]|nr:MAG: hypothetical protein KatS3mg027_0756 [Bacteroidia bacterium]